MSDLRWPAPQEEEETPEFRWAVIRTGLYFIVFSVLLFSLFLWLTSAVLENAGILSGSLTWTQSCALVAMFIFSRTWSRTFFK
jgi:hypothetical protein